MPWEESKHPREGGKFATVAGVSHKGKDVTSRAYTNDANEATRKANDSGEPEHHREAAESHSQAADYHASRGDLNGADKHRIAAASHHAAAAAGPKAPAPGKATGTVGPVPHSTDDTMAALGTKDANELTHKANASGSAEDHRRAGNMHRGAAAYYHAIGDTHGHAKHAAAADAHDAAIGAPPPGHPDRYKPDTSGNLVRPAPEPEPAPPAKPEGVQAGDSYLGAKQRAKTSVDRQNHRTATAKLRPADRERLKPFYHTGKTGTSRLTGDRAWEYHHPDTGERAWVRADGSVDWDA